MISLEEFIAGLKELRSEGSRLTNSYLLQGVHGMSMTQQMALGAAYRKGLNPSQVDMDEMKFNILGRLALSGIEIEGGLKVNKEKAEKSKVTKIFAAYQLRELYLDWKAGFEAAEQMNMTV